MIRKAYMIGILAAGLAVASLHTGTAWNRLVSSAQNVQAQFHTLGSTGSPLGLIERFIFSFVLANGR